MAKPIDKNDPRYASLKELVRSVVEELVSDSQSGKPKQKKKQPPKKEENIFDRLFANDDDIDEEEEEV